MGKLSSPTLALDPSYESFWRQDLHSLTAPGTGLYVSERYGGLGSNITGSDPDYYLRSIENKIAAITNDSFIERFGTSTLDGGSEYKLEVNNLAGDSRFLQMSPLTTKLESSYSASTSSSSFVMDHTSMSTTITQQLGILASFLKLESNKITLEAGEATIIVDSTIAATPTITIKSGTAEVVVGTTGLTVNGVPLATGKLVDWLVQNASTFSIGAMGPNAISPTALPNLVANSLLSVVAAPGAFKSDIG